MKPLLSERIKNFICAFDILISMGKFVPDDVAEAVFSRLNQKEQGDNRDKGSAEQMMKFGEQGGKLRMDKNKENRLDIFKISVILHIEQVKQIGSAHKKTLRQLIYRRLSPG